MGNIVSEHLHAYFVPKTTSKNLNQIGMVAITKYSLR